MDEEASTFSLTFLAQRGVFFAFACLERLAANDGIRELLPRGACFIIHCFASERKDERLTTFLEA